MAEDALEEQRVLSLIGGECLSLDLPSIQNIFGKCWNKENSMFPFLCTFAACRKLRSCVAVPAQPPEAAGHSKTPGGYKGQLMLDWQVGLGYFSSHNMCYKQEATVGWASSCITRVEGNEDG